MNKGYQGNEREKSRSESYSLPCRPMHPRLRRRCKQGKGEDRGCGAEADVSIAQIYIATRSHLNKKHSRRNSRDKIMHAPITRQFKKDARTRLSITRCVIYLEKPGKPRVEISLTHVNKQTPSTDSWSIKRVRAKAIKSYIFILASTEDICNSKSSYISNENAQRVKLTYTRSSGDLRLDQWIITYYGSFHFRVLTGNKIDAISKGEPIRKRKVLYRM